MNGGSETVPAGQHNIALSLVLGRKDGDVTKERISVSWGCVDCLATVRESMTGWARVVRRETQLGLRFRARSAVCLPVLACHATQPVTTDDLRKCIQEPTGVMNSIQTLGDARARGGLPGGGLALFRRRVS
jgi:hypothetical protein